MSDPDDTSGTRITLAYHRFKAMETELEQLRAGAAAERTPTGEAPGVALEALAAALPVIQFAVANLDPRTVRGWPAADLERLAELLEGALPEHSVLALALKTFAAECRELEAYRGERLVEALVTAARTDTAAGTGDPPDGGPGA